MSRSITHTKKSADLRGPMPLRWRPTGSEPNATKTSWNDVSFRDLLNASERFADQCPTYDGYYVLDTFSASYMLDLPEVAVAMQDAVERETLRFADFAWKVVADPERYADLRIGNGAGYVLGSMSRIGHLLPPILRPHRQSNGCILHLPADFTIEEIAGERSPMMMVNWHQIYCGKKGGAANVIDGVNRCLAVAGYYIQVNDVYLANAEASRVKKWLYALAAYGFEQDVPFMYGSAYQLKPEHHAIVEFVLRPLKQ
jgi:hypothetical protein